MTWVANVILIVGLFLVGERKRSAFVWTAAGEALWLGASLAEGRLDMAFICAVFLVMAVVNYFKWGKKQ